MAENIAKSAFNTRYSLDQATPLPEFDTAGGCAFKVVDAHAKDSALYGLVQKPEVPIRNSLYKSLVEKPIRNIISPIDRGIMTMPEGQRLVTVFERPTGGVFFGPDGVNPLVNVGRLRTNILTSALGGLAELHSRNHTHRLIRPSSVFFASPGSDEIILGECITAPPGSGQSLRGEAMECVFADDITRGNATEEADIYQLGFVLISGFFGENLDVSLDRDAILAGRVNQSSFWALSGGQDVPGALGKVLQGMLVDEPSERWNLADILDWLEGSTSQRRTGLVNRSLSKPTHFMGVAYIDRRLLAEAFALNVSEAARYLKEKKFGQWVQSNLRDEVLDDRMEKALGILGADNLGVSSVSDDQLIARICMFLHPDGPIRFKGYSIMPDSISAFVASAFASGSGDNIQAVHELIRPDLLSALVEISDKNNPALTKAVQNLSKEMALIKDRTLGKGAERVLYSLNPQIPCMSSKFNGQWIGSLKQLVHGFDREAPNGRLASLITDRHIAAFCAVHAGDMDKDFYLLSHTQKDPVRFSFQMAQFFGVLQNRTKIPALPKLTSALVESMKPALKLLKKVSRREKITKLLDSVKKDGNIAKLTSVVDLVEIQQQDAREFSAARRQIQLLEKERESLGRKITHRHPAALLKGYQLSAIFAASICLLSLAMIVI